jgi:hypothetical protein
MCHVPCAMCHIYIAMWLPHVPKSVVLLIILPNMGLSCHTLEIARLHE